MVGHDDDRAVAWDVLGAPQAEAEVRAGQRQDGWPDDVEDGGAAPHAP
jgi:hypothetical protein